MAAMLGPLLGACRTVPQSEISEEGTHVDRRMFFPEGSEHYQLSPLQAFVFPEPVDTPTPPFPEDFGIATLEPTTICVSMVVTTEGAVEWTGPTDGPGCVDPGMAPQLLQATLEQVRQWRFATALMCTYPDAASKARDRNSAGCNGEGVRAQAIPVTLSYAFVFEKRQGRGVVSTQPAGTP